ncbi:DUF445 family protein [Spectribacter hydrogenooxidans]|uniref:DUF445 family protein n=1 Tax=Spectribacter hydrogenoxidans TaxID=3075608 RepID=A0ABU3BZG3_9GAMM|nr:DUF445 family protein [Salinisphaera sp. W335]MDT0634504.1 DUF445 family protein [Salinisphaera sp. W335]
MEGFADFLANPLVYLSMPVISAIVGYGTNVVAIYMMFHPIEFIGVYKPILGWQGIIPRRAAKMAGISVDTITEKLIDQKEIFSRLDPERIAEELEGPLNNMVEDITNQVMLEHQPTLWESLPNVVKNQIYKRINREMPEIVAEIMSELKANIEQMYDLKDMVITNLTRDKALLNTIFQEVGYAEFKFIARSGIYFGGLFGVVQMIVWLFFQEWWLLPAFGLAVGYATNWLALQMIFNPKEVFRIGPFNIQGLFMKRQEEVAKDYGRLVSQELITPANIIEAVLKGPYSDKVFAMIGRHVQKAIDEQTSIAKPFVTFTVGTQNYIRMKNSAVEKIIGNMPDALKHVESYADDALDLQNTLMTRLQALSPEEFEGMLRPAFEQDEWILIAVGAALGFMVGVFQLIVLFGDEMGITGGGEAAGQAAVMLLQSTGLT